MGKSWKVNENRCWKQTCLRGWWKIYKNKNKNICRQYDYKFSWQKNSKRKSTCKCLSIIILDSIIKANKKYYPQTLLEECKYVQEKTKIDKHIDEDLEKSESDSDSNDETESDIDNDEYDK